MKRHCETKKKQFYSNVTMEDFTEKQTDYKQVKKVSEDF